MVRKTRSQMGTGGRGQAHAKQGHHQIGVDASLMSPGKTVTGDFPEQYVGDQDSGKNRERRNTKSALPAI